MEKAMELKEKGNACMKEGKRMEAIIHYTHALGTDPSNAQLYSNRSLAFFKEQQYFFALEDAKKAIQLDPTWFKGYVRKADVELACERFKEAAETCDAGLMMTPGNDALADLGQKARRREEQRATRERRYPVLGVGSGIVVGVLIVFADELFLDGKPFLESLLLKVAVVFLLGLIGKAGAELYKYVNRWSHDQLLEAPPDIFGNDLSKGFFPPGNAEKDSSQKSDSPKKKKTGKKD